MDKAKLMMLRSILKTIDDAINHIAEFDPYGDMDENFKEGDKETNITKRLIEMVEKDLA